MKENNKIVDYLKQLGLTEIEATLYLILIKSGALSVKDLAQMSGIKRTTSYMYIDQLVEKGLLMKVVRGSKKQVAANLPKDCLKNLIEDKLDSAKAAEKDLPEMLKKINAIPHTHDINNTEIIYLKGIKSVRGVYEDAFKCNEIRSYVKIEEKALLSDDNSDFFRKAFDKNKNLKIREIVYDSAVSRIKALKILSENKNYFYKFMPGDLNWSSTSEDILIYEGKVALMNYVGKPTATILHSPGFYHNSKQIFDFIWRILPAPTP